MTDADEKAVDPWDRDQKGKLGDGFVVIDDVTLPGVFGRSIKVEYQEDKKAQWPIKLTIEFYLDELEIDPSVADFAEYTLSLTGPQEVVADEQQTDH